jgi:hypothetical protein
VLGDVSAHLQAKLDDEDGPEAEINKHEESTTDDKSQPASDI